MIQYHVHSGDLCAGLQATATLGCFKSGSTKIERVKKYIAPLTAISAKRTSKGSELDEWNE